MSAYRITIYAAPEDRSFNHSGLGVGIYSSSRTIELNDLPLVGDWIELDLPDLGLMSCQVKARLFTPHHVFAEDVDTVRLAVHNFRTGDPMFYEYSELEDQTHD
jgi:hypothetical protein